MTQQSPTAPLSSGTPLRRKAYPSYGVVRSLVGSDGDDFIPPSQYEHAGYVDAPTFPYDHFTVDEQTDPMDLDLYHQVLPTHRVQQVLATAPNATGQSMLQAERCPVCGSNEHHQIAQCGFAFTPANNSNKALFSFSRLAQLNDQEAINLLIQRAVDHGALRGVTAPELESFRQSVAQSRARYQET